MANVSLKLRPFAVPDKVVVELPPGLKQDGMQPLPTLTLAQLSDETLAELIEEFSTNVLIAAGKMDKATA